MDGGAVAVAVEGAGAGAGAAAGAGADLMIEATGGGALTTRGRACDCAVGEVAVGATPPAARWARSSCRNGLLRKVAAACWIASRSARMVRFGLGESMETAARAMVGSAGLEADGPLGADGGVGATGRTGAGGGGPMGAEPSGEAEKPVEELGTNVFIGRRKVLLAAGGAAVGVTRVSVVFGVCWVLVGSVGGSFAGIGDDGGCDMMEGVAAGEDEREEANSRRAATRRFARSRSGVEWRRHSGPTGGRAVGRGQATANCETTRPS